MPLRKIRTVVLAAEVVLLLSGIAFSQQPVFGPAVNMGPKINTASYESDPFLTTDGKKLFFVCARPEGYGQEDICFSEWTDTGWTTPTVLGAQINSLRRELSPSVSPDGQKLYYVDASRGGAYWDVWVSTWDSSINDWGTPVNLGPPVNTSGGEYSVRIGPDGRHLYMSISNDIGCGLYVSEWDGSSWSIPIPLGAGQCAISEYPTITANLTEVYYHQYVSDGISIFANCWNGSIWGPQIDLRTQIGGRAVTPFITLSGDSLFFAGSVDLGGYGARDIWMATRLLSGDLNLDSQLSLADVVLELQKVFLNQAYPAPSGAGDLTCDGRFTPADITILLLKVFAMNAYLTE